MRDIRIVLVAAILLATFAPVSVLAASGTINNYNNCHIDIPDGPSGATASATVDTSTAPSGSVITKVKVYYEVRHLYKGDLKIWLTAYYGGSWHDFILRNQEGTSGDDWVETRDNLHTWDGASPNQTWYLSVKDMVSGDVGYIDFLQVWVYWADSGNINVDVENSSGSRLGASEMNAVILFDSGGTEQGRIPSPSSNPMTFSDKPFGSYFVDVYCWDMLTARTSTFSHNSPTTTVYPQTNSKRSIKTTVYYTGESVLYGGAQVRLDSLNGQTQQWSLSRASGITASDGTFTFSAWPTTVTGEKYRIRVLNSSGTQVGSQDNVTRPNNTNTVNYIIETTEPVPNQDPVISIDTPLNNAVVAGNVAIVVTAYDPEDGVPSKIEYYVDNLIRYTDLFPDAQSPTSSWTWNTTSASEGNHTIKAVAWDGNSNSGEDSVTVEVRNMVNHSPQLSDGYVTPTSGSPTTTFTYYVTYKDSDGDAPSLKTVNIDGSGGSYSHNMTYVSGGYTTGAIYKYETTGLSVGSHSFYFLFNDGNGGSYQTDPPTNGPTVSAVNQDPVISIDTPLNNAVVAGNVAIIVTAYDPEDGVPSKIEYYVDNLIRYTDLFPDAQSPTSSWTWNTTSASEGNHTIKAVAWDGNSNSGEDSVTVEVRNMVNHSPQLSDGYVTPTSGSPTTTFTYYVTYADPDGDIPSVKLVNIDGSGGSYAHNMTYVSGSYTTGATYKYRTTLPAGGHSFYFLFADGKGGSDDTNPPTNGPSVAFDYPASPLEDDSVLGNVPSLCGSDADPVNTATGNFYHNEIDLTIVTRSMPLQFARYYNSKDIKDGPLGIGWTHSYNILLTSGLGTGGNQVSIRWGDGRTDYWISNGVGGYDPDVPGLYDTLEVVGSTWRLTRKNLDVYVFDSAGKLLTITDKNGNTFTLNYNGSSQLTSIIDPAGRTVTLSYYPDGKLASITDFASPARTVFYQYTTGKLTQVTDAAGNLVVYTYETNGYLATIRDQRNVTVITNIYDANGRVTQQTDGKGYVTTFTYGTENGLNKTTIGYLDGTSNDHLHSENNLLLMIRYSQGSVQYTYNDNMERTQIMDRNGNVNNFSFDTFGNVLTAVDPDNPEAIDDGGVTKYEYTDIRFPFLPTQKTDVLGHVTSWEYDSFGNCTKQIDPDGLETLWTYNSFGQKLTETDKNGNTTTYVYDADGKLTEVIDAEGNSTEYGYDTLWRPVQITDGEDNITQTVYDNLDRVIAVHGPLTSISYQYDAVGNKTHVTDPMLQTTVYTYDNNNNLLSISKPAPGGQNQTIQYSYDNRNRKISMTDTLGHATQYTYDDMGRLETETDPKGNITTFTYDAQGNILTQTDGSGVTVSFAYDTMNRRLQQTDELGNTQSWEYYKTGQLKSATDANGNITRYTYDALDRLISVTNPENRSTAYEYDGIGNVTVIRDAGGRLIARKFYNRVNRLIRQEDGLGNAQEFTYDDVGNLTQVSVSSSCLQQCDFDNNGQISLTDLQMLGQFWLDDNPRIDIAPVNGNGIVDFFDFSELAGCWNDSDGLNRHPQVIKQMTYDQEYRLTRVNYADGSQVINTYDNNGNLLTVSDATGTTTFVYDQLNRLISSTDCFGKTIQYTYNLANNRTGVVYPADSTKPARTVAYSYDTANRLDTITDWEGRIWDYTLDGAGKITQLTYPNGVKRIQSYDGSGRLEYLGYINSGETTLMSFDYFRDEIGNPVSIEETGTLTPNLSSLSNNLKMSFDADNRLLSANQDLYGYDNRGNVKFVSKAGQVTKYTFNYENSLVFQSSESSTVQHLYNGLNHRIAKTTNGVQTRYGLDYGRDMSHVLYETNVAGDITAYYIHGPEIVGRIDAAGSPKYYHTDAVGSVIALTDNTAAVTDRYVYTPFGDLAGREGTTENPFTYVGGYGVMSENDGLYFMRARFYESRTARFLGKDPVEGTLQSPMSLYRYNYVQGNPIILIDSDGRVVHVLPVLAAVIIPGIVNGGFNAGEYIWDNWGDDDFSWGWGTNQGGGVGRYFVAGFASGSITAGGAAIGALGGPSGAALGAIVASPVGTYAKHGIEDGRWNNWHDMKEDLADYAVSAVVAPLQARSVSGTRAITHFETAFFGSLARTTWENSLRKGAIKFMIHIITNAPAFNDPKLNIDYANGTAKSFSGGGSGGR